MQDRVADGNSAPDQFNVNPVNPVYVSNHLSAEAA